MIAFGLAGMPLEVVALIHTADASGILSFAIIHVYMIASGPTSLTHTRAMISGWEGLENLETAEDWDIKTKAAKSVQVDVRAFI
ncbi:MAG: hypothetical protein PVI82_04695 [Desulfobacterales bacterium]